MKKTIAFLLACVMVSGLLAACSKIPAENKGDSAAAGITLKVWAAKEDQADENSWILRMEKAFEEAHPEYNIIWKNGVCSEGYAATTVCADPAAAADVYIFMNDMLGTLLYYGALTQLDGAYLEQIQKDVSATYINTVTHTDGKVYGFPVASRSTCLLYYNKQSLSEEDVKSLETCLAKGVVSFDVGNSWYLPSFFFAAGGTLFGETGTDAAAGIQFGGEVAINAAHAVLDLMENPNFVANDTGNAGLKDGSVDACFAGSWDYAGLREALGENLGVAVPPTVTINGEAKQLKPYATSTAIGVNPHAENHEIAMQFAAFLASAESQLLRFQLRNITPAVTALAEHPDIAASTVAAAESATMASASVALPTISEMTPVWSPIGTFGANLVDGIITQDNVAVYVKDFEEQFLGN